MTEPARRRPLRRLLRSLRRSRGLVVAPDLPAGDVARVVKAIDDVLAQRETNAQRAAAGQLVAAYAGLVPTGGAGSSRRWPRSSAPIRSPSIGRSIACAPPVRRWNAGRLNASSVTR